MRFVLLETAMGYLLFERKESDEIGATLPEVQAAVKDYSKFSLVLKLKAQFFFRTAEEALANINDISEGIVTPSLKVHRNQLNPWHSPRDVNPSPPTQAFLEPNVPAGKAGKKAKVAMGVSEHGACPLPCSKCCTSVVRTQRSARPQARPLSHAARPQPRCETLTGLGKAIQEQLNIACVCNDLTAELLRGARAHTTKFLSVLKPGDLEKVRG